MIVTVKFKPPDRDSRVILLSNGLVILVMVSPFFMQVAFGAEKCSNYAIFG